MEISRWGDLDIVSLSVEEDGPVGHVEDEEAEREHDARHPVHGDGLCPFQLLQIERCLWTAAGRAVAEPGLMWGGRRRAG